MFIVVFNNNSKLETMQMAISRTLNKQIVSIHTIEYYSLIKKS